MKIKILVTLSILALSGLAFILWPIIKHEQPIACTAEAKICPDGSAVGRTGPNCQFAECPDDNVVVSNKDDITLAVGQTGKVGELTIKLNTFIQDSRCPVDVVCIEAGAVNVNVTLKDTTHSETKNFPSDEVPQKFGNYKISIINISPPRKSKIEIQSNEYRITFHAENINTKGILVGQVTLSPTCPVERIPPDPNCAPKGYSTLVNISSANNFFIELHTDMNGGFRTELLPGTYTIMEHSNSLYPRCDSKKAIITAGATTSIIISCDSGIR